MSQAIIDTITGFLDAIGIQMIRRPINAETFLPGVELENRKIIVDTDKLLYPGDMLHEAGHLAAYSPEERKTIGYPLPEFMSAAFEVMAIGWSYASCLHIGLEPTVVFHERGYKGGGDSFLEHFSHRRYLGVPMLQ